MRSVTLKIAAALLACCLIWGMAGCGRPAPPPAPPPVPGPAPGQPLPLPRPFQQTAKLAQASTLEATAEAIRAVIQGSLSLRLADDPSPPSRAVPVSPGDVVALAYLEHEAHATPVYSLVEFLAAAGVTLEDEASPLTSAQLLPHLQNQVDWSYDNPQDERALLGVMLATAPGAAGPPASAPSFTTETLLSPTAALMLMADILIGVSPEDHIGVFPVGGRIAHAATPTSDRVQGLIFRTRQVLMRPGGSPYMHALLGAYALGNRFAVRLLVDDYYRVTDSLQDGGLTWRSTRAGLKALPVAKTVTLDRTRRELVLVAVTALLPTRESSFAERGAVLPGGMILEALPVKYDFRLISEATLGLAEPLCEDADVTMLFADEVYFTDASVHPWTPTADWVLAPYHARLESDMPLPVLLRASLLQNDEPQSAVLLVSARMWWPDLEPILAQNPDLADILGITLDEIRAVLADLQREVAFPPWMCTVLVRPSTLAELEIDPELSGAVVGDQCEFTVRETPEVDRGILAGVHYEYEWQVFAAPDDAALVPRGEAVVKRSDSRQRQAGHVGSTDGPPQAFRVTLSEPGTYEVRATLRVLSDPRGLYPNPVMERLASGSARVEVRPPEPGTIRITLTSNPMPAEVGTAVAITAAPEGDFTGLSESVIWRWDFGDGSPPQETRPQALHTVKGGPVSSRMSRTYQQPGSYELTVAVIDSASGAVIATTEHMLVVLSDLAVIGRTTAMRAVLEAWCNYDWYSYQGSERQTSVKGFYQRKGLATDGGVLEWQGATFAAAFEGRLGPAAPVGLSGLSTSSDADYRIRITGTVADDARSLSELVVSWEAVDHKYGATLSESLTLRGVPLKKAGLGDSVEFLAVIKGETVAQYVAGYEFAKIQTATGRLEEKFTGFSWDKGSYYPSLELQFRISPPPDGWRSRL